MKQIAVIGLSSFGYYLALKLSELGSQVLVIDQDEALIDRIKTLVAKAVLADATDPRVLAELGVSEMDVIVLSLGEKLEASILAAMHLKEMGAKRIIAKALSEDHARVLELIGVNQIIFPERDMGVRLAWSLQRANIADYLPLSTDLSIIEIIPLKEMIGKTLEELDFRKRYNCQIVAIKETTPREATFIPHADTIIKEDHLLIVMGNNKDLTRLQQKLE
jgi:trk system potassium uptake protein TrkA